MPEWATLAANSNAGAAGNSGTVDIGNAATADLNLAGYFFTGGVTNFAADSTVTENNAVTDEVIDITANTTIKSASAITFTGAAIDVANGVTSLKIDSGSAALTLTDIHGDGTADTLAVDIDGGAVSVKNIGNSAAIDEVNTVDITGTAITLNGAIYTDGTNPNIAFNGPVSLGGATLLVQIMEL